MKVNGTRVEDLAGTGLVTNQRYVMPLYVTVPLFLLKTTARITWCITIHAIRGWAVTLPVLLLVLVYAARGWLGVLTVVMWAMAVGLAWARRWATSFDQHVTQVTRGVWRWQARYRRGWHPAMDGTGLTRSTPSREVFVPRVTAVRSTRVVDTLHVRLLHGQTPADLAERAEGLRHVFSAHRCTVIEDGPGRVRVVFYNRDPLTKLIPIITPDSLPALDGLTVGRAEDGTDYAIHLIGRHLLIAGASGAGKGSVLWSVIRALAPAVAAGTVRLRGVDPKGGMELYPGRALFGDYADEDLADMVALLERAVADMHARKKRLKAAGQRVFIPSTTDPLEVIVVDELAFLTAYAPKDIKLKVAAAVQVLLSQGRAVGYSVVAALQDPRKDVLPFRDLFTYRIALRLAEDSHVDMVLGDGALDRGAACHLIPASLPGVGFVHVEGAHEPVRVRFTYLDDNDITATAQEWPAPGQASTPAAGRVIDLTDPPSRPPRPTDARRTARSDHHPHGHLGHHLGYHLGYVRAEYGVGGEPDPQLPRRTRPHARGPARRRRRRDPAWGLHPPDHPAGHRHLHRGTDPRRRPLRRDPRLQVPAVRGTGQAVADAPVPRRLARRHRPHPRRRPAQRPATRPRHHPRRSDSCAG